MPSTERGRPANAGAGQSPSWRAIHAQQPVTVNRGHRRATVSNTCNRVFSNNQATTASHSIITLHHNRGCVGRSEQASHREHCIPSLFQRQLRSLNSSQRRHHPRCDGRCHPAYYAPVQEHWQGGGGRGRGLQSGWLHTEAYQKLL